MKKAVKSLYLKHLGLHIDDKLKQSNIRKNQVGETDCELVPESTVSKITNGKIGISSKHIYAFVETLNLKTTLDLLLPTDDFCMSITSAIIWERLLLEEGKQSEFQNCLMTAMNIENQPTLEEIESFIRNNNSFLISLKKYVRPYPEDSFELIDDLINWQTELAILITQIATKNFQVK